MNDVLIIIVLALVIGALIVERHFLTRQYHSEKDRLLEELSRATKAVISKNANDYVMTTSIDKVPTEASPEPNPDLVPEETLNDEEFMQGIAKRNEPKA